MTATTTTGGVLCCFAHPDDEQFGTAGALHVLAARGVPVTVLAATRGDAGEISDPDLATRETLGSVRTEELQTACAMLGLEPPILFDYRDGYLSLIDPAILRDDLVEVVRRLRPRVLITFDRNGGYGHPDHIAIHRAALAAFAAAADPDHRPELGPPHRVDKLYVTAYPRSNLAALDPALAAIGMEPLSFGSVQTVEGDQLGTPDEAITTRVDVRDVFPLRLSTLFAHRTQYGPASMWARLPEEVNRRLMGEDHFLRLVPPPTPGATLPDETDLWAGLPPVEATR